MAGAQQTEGPPGRHGAEPLREAQRIKRVHPGKGEKSVFQAEQGTRQEARRHLSSAVRLPEHTELPVGTSPRSGFPRNLPSAFVPV